MQEGLAQLGHNEFVINLTGTTAGTYNFCVGLSSFELTAKAANGGILKVINSATPGAVERTDPYVTLDATGTPISWLLSLVEYRYVGGVMKGYQAGYSCGYTSICGDNTVIQDFYGDITFGVSPDAYHDFGYVLGTPTSGNWSAVSPTTTVPEPSTYALMGVGMLGLMLVRRRTRKANLA